MERIVNGHFADPNSTRDIVGITPKEFELLITILQEKYKQIELFFEGDPDKLHELIISSGMFVGELVTVEKIEKVLPILKEAFAEQYDIIYKFLNAINQPYPGANYG